MKMSMEHWWNEIDRKSISTWRKTFSLCHFVRHKSHMDCPAIEPGLSRWQTVD